MGAVLQYCHVLHASITVQYMYRIWVQCGSIATAYTAQYRIGCSVEILIATA